MLNIKSTLWFDISVLLMDLYFCQFLVEPLIVKQFYATELNFASFNQPPFSRNLIILLMFKVFSCLLQRLRENLSFLYHYTAVSSNCRNGSNPEINILDFV